MVIYLLLSTLYGRTLLSWGLWDTPRYVPWISEQNHSPLAGLSTACCLLIDLFFFSLLKPSEGVYAEDLGVFLAWLKTVSSEGIWFSLFFLYNAIKLESRVAGTKTDYTKTKRNVSCDMICSWNSHSCPLKISYTSIKLHPFPSPSSMKRVYKPVNFILFAIVYSLQQ